MKNKNTETTNILITALRDRFCWFIIFLLFVTPIIAQVPQAFNYQAVVRNSLGVIVLNQAVSARFTIRNDSLNGGIAYRETHGITTTPTGIFTVVIGAGNIISGSFGNVHWTTGNVFLQVEVDITGGTNYVDMGTTQLLSVPYALYSEVARTIALKEDTFPTQNGNFTLTLGNTGYISLASSVIPSAALVTAITPGTVVGQVVIVNGASSGPNGVSFQTTTTNLNIGTTGGNLPLTKGSMLTLMWDGMNWVKLAYSQNN